MADFLTAWAKTSRFEAGWANDSRDPGKETYRGISRVNNPDCDIWPDVDKVKKSLGLTNTVDAPQRIRDKIDAALAFVKGLADRIAAFYKRKYWDPLNLDAEPSQAIAETTFDIAVNQGVSAAKEIYGEATEGI